VTLETIYAPGLIEPYVGGPILNTVTAFDPTTNEAHDCDRYRCPNCGVSRAGCMYLAVSWMFGFKWSWESGSFRPAARRFGVGASVAFCLMPSASGSPVIRWYIFDL
jgi:hypothetical protein